MSFDDNGQGYCDCHGEFPPSLFSTDAELNRFPSRTNAFEGNGIATKNDKRFNLLSNQGPLAKGSNLGTAMGHVHKI